MAKDEGFVSKTVIGLAVVVGGVVTVLAFWKWRQQSGEQGKPAADKSSAVASKPTPASAASTSTPTATKPSPTPQPAASTPTPAATTKPTPPAASGTQPTPAAASKPTPPAATGSQPAPAAASKPSPAASQPTPAAPKPAASAAQPTPQQLPASTLRDAPKSEQRSVAPALSTTPPISLRSSDGNGSDLSMSATFEKVSAEPSLTLSSMSSSYTSGTTTPPTTGSTTPPKMGGPKSLEDCDWSKESPVFGGQPISMLDDSDMSNFDPSTQHPATFGFKFDGPTF